VEEKMKNYIKQKELTTLMIDVICIKLLLTFPKGMVMQSGTGAWLQMIFVTVLSYIIFKISVMFYKKCGNKNIIELSGEIGGRVFKGIVSIAVFLVLCSNIWIVTSEIPESIKLFLLPDMPVGIMTALLIFTAAVGAYMGIWALCNFIAILAIPAIISVAVFVLSIMGEMDFCNISPVLGKGIGSIIGGWSGISVFCDIILINLFLPYYKDIDEAEKSGNKAIIISGCIGLIITVVYTLIYPYPLSEQIFMPMYRMARGVDIGGVFRQAESILAFIICITAFTAISAYSFAIGDVLKQGLELKSEKPLLLPSAVFAAAGMIFELNTMEILKSERFMAENVSIISFLLPAVISVIYILKKRSVKK